MTLLDAAKVFSFEIPEWLDDNIAVGKLAGVTIYAGEVRRLNQALDNPYPAPTTSHDEELLGLMRGGNRINAIKLRREVTGEGLKEAKDYCDQLGLRHGVLHQDVNGIVRFINSPLPCY